MQALNMPLRKYHHMAGVEGIKIDGHDKTVPPSHFKVLHVWVTVPYRTENTIYLRFIAFDVFYFFGIEEIISH